MTVSDVAAPPATNAIPGGQLRRLLTGYRAMGWLAALLPPVLMGYAFFDRAFAYIHVPGIPIFPGEAVILLCLTEALIGTGIVSLGIRRLAVSKLVILFALLGVICTAPYVPRYGINAIRDAALWYYALLAIPVAALVISDPEIVGRWVAGARRVIPWFLLYCPFAVLANKASEGGTGPFVPGSSISVWNHKVSNIAVLVTMIIAFVWLVPGFNRRRRTLFLCLGTLVVLMVATQNRGALVASAIGILLAWLFSMRRLRLVGVMVGTLAVLAIVGWASNVQFKGEQGRVISVGQVITNIQSVRGKDANASGNLQSNVEFRQQLWSDVIAKAEGEHKLLTGLGFGRNIAADLGFAPDTSGFLRSPHNSHLDVFARMGLIGTALWIVLWLTWFSVVIRARKRLKAIGRFLEASFIEVSIVGVTAILVNAYFDPTLESPQVAIWLWTLVGLTVGLAARRVSHSAQADHAGKSFDKAS